MSNELFSVRHPAEQSGPAGKKCYFSSFGAAQRYLNEQLEEYKDRSLTMLFIPIKTEIDGVQRALWGVYIDEYDGFNGGIDGFDFD